MHVHTFYSTDSLITPKELVSFAKNRRLDGVAVTDHDRLEGALNIARETDFLVLPGVEVSCSEGHVVGLNVNEEITAHLSADETVDKIHEAGGIAVACHPTGLFKGGLGKRTSAKFDAVEVINSSAVPFHWAVRENERIAARLGKPRLAGSDAHYGPEIGCAFTLVNSESETEGVIKAIVKGQCQPFGGPIPLAVRLRRTLAVRARGL
jgi:predicted metal-dependent phosphoesterase TrpH